jgi:hypothetical protein
MEYSLKGKECSVEVGLDGVYRTTELPEETVAFKGDWLYDDTFRFSYINVGHNCLRKQSHLKEIGYTMILLCFPILM